MVLAIVGIIAIVVCALATKRKPVKRPRPSFVGKMVVKNFRDVLHKTTSSTVQKADGRTRTFCFTSGSVDRDNDTIDPAGWDFSAWLKNPVILGQHSYDDWPIGRGSNLRRVGDKWFVDVTFASTPEGDTALALVDDGCLNAMSVGFMGTESTYNAARGGTDFREQQLLEISVVGVPSNVDALIQRSAALGLDRELVTKMFGRRLKLGETNPSGGFTTIEAIRPYLNEALDHAHELFPPGSLDVVDPSMSSDDVDQVLWLDDEQPAPARSFRAKVGARHNAADFARIKGMHDLLVKAGATPSPDCGRCGALARDNSTDVSYIPGDVAAIADAVTKRLLRKLNAKIDAARWAPSEPFQDPALRHYRRGGRS